MMNYEETKRMGSIFKLYLATAVVLVAISLEAKVSNAQGIEGKYIGEIFMMGARYCPRGALRAEGQTLPIQDNQALFSVLGTTYGGDGRTNFRLPKLEGSTGAGEKITTCVVIDGVYPPRW